MHPPTTGTDIRTPAADPAAPRRSRIQGTLRLLVVSALVGCVPAADALADRTETEAANPGSQEMEIPTGGDATQDTLLYAVGDVYANQEFEATYLGMAKLPLGTGRIWEEGSCVTLLFEVTYLDPPGGSDRFRPSVTGYFTDGREAEKDETGVGCAVRSLPDLGYEQGARRRVARGETTRVFVGAVYIPPSDDGELAYATLYRRDHIRMAVDIVLDVPE